MSLPSTHCSSNVIKLDGKRSAHDPVTLACTASKSACRCLFEFGGGASITSHAVTTHKKNLTSVNDFSMSPVVTAVGKEMPSPARNIDISHKDDHSLFISNAASKMSTPFAS